MDKETKPQIKKFFITGLILLIPLWITVYIVWLFIKFVSSIVSPFIITLIVMFELPQNMFLVRFISFLLALGVIYLIGVLANTIFGRQIFKKIELLIMKIPLVSDVYIAAKKIVNFFTEYKNLQGNKVVVVEYPRKGVFSFGIVTIEAESKIGVFIPSTPNPTTGYLVFFPKDEVVYTTFSIDEALRIIVSGGIASGKIDEIKKYL